jgi:GT2 family glycosyltransferase
MEQTIITLTRYPEIFARLKISVDYWEPQARKIVVTSGGAKVNAENWEQITGIEPFIFARNANLGLSVAQGDVLLINDDCELTQPILKTCQEITQANPEIGILSPQIDGNCGANLLQRFRPRDEQFYISQRRLAFVCVYLPTKTIATIGNLDENFCEYGFDDDDYCYRCQDAGLILAVTPQVVVKHGFGEFQGSSSFLRAESLTQRNWSVVKMWLKLQKKYLSKWLS